MSYLFINSLHFLLSYNSNVIYLRTIHVLHLGMILHCKIRGSEFLVLKCRFLCNRKSSWCNHMCSVEQGAIIQYTELLKWLAGFQTNYLMMMTMMILWSRTAQLIIKQPPTNVSSSLIEVISVKIVNQKWLWIISLSENLFNSRYFTSWRSPTFSV